MFPSPNDPYYTVEKHGIQSFFPFSPLLHQDSQLHDLFFNQPAAAPPAAPPEKVVRRRPARKDRHSKIYTAQGPRDRRMRLSLDVARKFFDLQDLLGFDKASKTVQWLLNMSKSAIKELVAAGAKIEGFSSECEEDISTVSDNKGKSQAAVPLVDPKSQKKPRPSFPVAKESRVKARERARERTLGKKMMQAIAINGGAPEDSSSHDRKSSLEIVAEMEERCSTSPIPVKEGENHGSSSTTMFDYNQAVENLLEEQWEMSFSGNIDERVLLGDLHLQPRLFDHV